MRILIVEDSFIDGEYMRRMLRQSEGEFTIDIIEDGEEAMNAIKIENMPYQFIMLDINLPKYNGHEILKEIRNLSIYDYTPVLIITSSGDNRDVTMARENGADGYIIKGQPFSVEDLEAYIPKRMALLN